MLLTSALLLSSSAHAEEENPSADQVDEAAFAESLFAEGDYYRSIGEFKRALFLSPGAPQRGRWLLRIGDAYREGEQHEAAARHFDRVADELPGARGEALLGAAKSYLSAGFNETAAARASEAAESWEGVSTRVRTARYVEGWALLQAGRDDQAVRAFEQAKGAGILGERSERMVELLPRLENLPHRSPALAGALGIVPGLGHLYIGQPGVALSALVWNGIFGWALVEAIRDQNYSLALVLGAFEVMWYGGSIVGAISGAHRFNRDARLNALDDLARVAPPTLPDDYRPLAR